jgi:predicted aconitase
MKKTPDEVSRARQQAGQEIKIWRAAIHEACLNLSLSLEEREAKISFGKSHISLCRKKIAETLNKGKKEFWPR